MKLSTSLVAVKKITSSKPRSSFANSELEKAAKLILETEGVINPIVVRRTGLESYEVVDGDFEYYAAARAREIEPRKGEMIGTFIIESENEESLIEQIKAFRQQNSNTSSNLNSESGSNTTQLEDFIKNLESGLENKINEMLKQVTVKQETEEELKKLQKKAANKVEPLEVFNTLSPLELTSRLKSAGINDKQVNKIVESVEQERKKEKFGSLNDVVQRVKVTRGAKQEKGITSDRMVNIIDSWLAKDKP